MIHIIEENTVHEAQTVDAGYARRLPPRPYAFKDTPERSQAGHIQALGWIAVGQRTAPALRALKRSIGSPVYGARRPLPRHLVASTFALFSLTTIAYHCILEWHGGEGLPGPGACFPGGGSPPIPPEKCAGQDSALSFSRTARHSAGKRCEYRASAKMGLPT
jgi:hypothetical protein